MNGCGVSWAAGADEGPVGPGMADDGLGVPGIWTGANGLGATGGTADKGLGVPVIWAGANGNMGCPV